jgi:DNA-binding transcriptional ArsR family regulator
MATNEDVIERLDKIAAILKLAHRADIESARTSIRADRVSAEILDMTSDWVAAGKLKSSVIMKTKQSKPTVERRIASLVEHGALERRGAGSASGYRSTGLI